MTNSRRRVPGLRIIGCLLAGSVLACQPSSSTERGAKPDSAPSSSDRANTDVATPQGEANKPVRTNRLATETSPYLLLHAHNPVDWYPWGPEALAKAKSTGKLIFLSIGYSSCYWCHVMERESFSDEEIANFLNQHFVCIKVDREERPDIDDIYMNALQVYNQLAGSGGGGGWPLSMFLTPAAEPILGGTYFPPRDREGFTGFLTVLRRVQELWQTEPGRLKQNGQRLASIVKDVLRRRPSDPTVELAAEHDQEVLAALAKEFDPQYGGFGYQADSPRQPKFPEPSNLVFLLDYVRRVGDGPRAAEAREMLLLTLDKMAAGGIRDHLGGGFHRYSTDRFWAIPHFEKMLYDNGQLASLYAEAFALTGREEYRRVLEELLDFVLREMTGDGGGFYSALDAETEGVEGAYYRWSRDELTDVLTPSEYEKFAAVYGIAGEPNFEEFYVPLLSRPLEESAAALKQEPAELASQLEAIRAKLLEVRSQRPRPRTDEKILTSWNGLMIRGFADAGRILGEQRYVNAARTAAEFILANLRTEEGRLLRTFAAGEAKLNAYLDDYVLLADGLIALHRATNERRWLDEAEQLVAMTDKLFWDEERGGYFFTSSDHEVLIARSKDPIDSVIPSGNGVMAANLLYLAAANERPQDRARARQTVEAFAALMQQAPGGMTRLAVAAADLFAQPPEE